MSYRGMLQVVADFFGGSRAIPAKAVSPETELQLREKHALLCKKARDFRIACVEVTDEWWVRYLAQFEELAQFETLCEETYGLDLEHKWWLKQ